MLKTELHKILADTYRDWVQRMQYYRLHSSSIFYRDGMVQLVWRFHTGKYRLPCC